jgi:cobyrinic acid a,c-diamide synthase
MLMMHTNIPRILISGVKGKIGKTTITLGIIKGLKEKGLRVQPFKIGPDFIDPSYHTLIADRMSRNLDSIMFNDKTLIHSFINGSIGSDIAVVEGVLGLYDSPDGVSELGSSAQISKILKTPVILILDAERINRGLQAILQGFLSYDKDVRIRGIILNNVANQKQAEKIINGIEQRFKNIEIVGSIMRDSEIEESMSYRHLGLIHIAERWQEYERINNIAERIKKQIDFKKIIEISKECEELVCDCEEHNFPPFNIKVGIIRDNVFSFYYPENLEFFHKTTKKLYYIDSINDTTLPDIDLLIIGGGFPEIYAEQLEKNKSLRNDIKFKVEKGLMVYSECGGLMYLTNKIRTFDGNEYHMIGLIDGSIEMIKKPVGHGYVHLKVIKNNPMSKIGTQIIGHEFHYSKLFLNERVSFAYKVTRGYGIDGSHDGIIKDNILASYTHIHVNHNPTLFYNLLKNVEQKRQY